MEGGSQAAFIYCLALASRLHEDLHPIVPQRLDISAGFGVRGGRSSRLPASKTISSSPNPLPPPPQRMQKWLSARRG